MKFGKFDMNNLVNMLAKRLSFFVKVLRISILFLERCKNAYILQMVTPSAISNMQNEHLCAKLVSIRPRTSPPKFVTLGVLLIKLTSTGFFSYVEILFTSHPPGICNGISG